MNTAIYRMIKEKPKAWLLLILFISVSTRILTGISYIEDPDSLRFALAVKDFDLQRLQPHFPGYPVYVFLVRIFFLITGKLNLAFAIVGGISTFLLIWGAMSFARRLRSVLDPLLLILLVFFNPLLWLMSNRYMPDLLGLSVLVWCLYFFLGNDERDKIGFSLLAGLLAGIRLSYVPFLIVPLAMLLYKRQLTVKMIVAGTMAIMAWLVPLMADTGVNGLLESASKQASGHFYDWGGSVITDPGYSDRLYSFLSGVLAHGLGLWWPGRAILTAATTLLLLAAMIFHKGKVQEKLRLPHWFIFSVLGYIIWAFFFQNILFNPRHLMPVIFFILICISWLLSNTKTAIIFLFFLSYSGTTIVLAIQHKQPSAISQASTQLRDMVRDGDQIISTEVVNYYLDMTGIKGTKYDIRRQKPEKARVTYVIGNFSTDHTSAADSTWYYYHNPYVNLIWPTLKVTRIENK